MRRRGYTPAALRDFCERIGVTRSDGIVDVGVLEFCVRDDLDKNAPRAMCVLQPLKVTLTNYPVDKIEILAVHNHPNRAELGDRTIPFTQSIFIEQEDFREEANKKYKRLVLGKRVRLRNAYVIEADTIVRDEQGNIVEIIAHIIEGTLGKDPEDGVKAKGVIHWVSATQHVNCEVRLYERLFTDEAPDAGGKNFLDCINPDSMEVLQNCKAELSLAQAKTTDHFQFERQGYFCLDTKYSSADKLVFNRTISLKDSFAKIDD
jgi:glutaminyl-tRNA synthetase